MEEEQGVNIEQIIQEWEIARTNREHYTLDFQTLDNLVDGAPVNHQDKSPYVGDTTLAGLVRSIPRQSLQQLPVFSTTVNGTSNNVQSQICSYLLRRGVFNEDTFGKGLLSTLQIGAEQALTHGYAPFMVATGSMYNDFGTTMRLLHYADVDPEPGIQDANESAYYFVSANLTKSRVRKILQSAQQNENTSWNVEKLKELLAMQPDPKSYSIYQSEARAQIQSEQTANTYQIVTRYEVGSGGKFVTFCPQIQDAPLRVIESRSKFGYPRVNFLVIDPAPLSPFGISRVRLSSPNQNLMNIYYQNIASMLLLNSKPPILKRGRFTKPVQLKQGAIWEALDQNAQAELKNMDNGALQSFVPMAQQMSAQIQNMMGSPTGTVNANSNTFGFSKTAPGVQMQQKHMDTTANQVTKILENFLRQYALVALDTYIAEQSGEDVLIVDDDCKNAINRIVPDMIGEDNKFELVWEEFYEGIEDWTVKIDLSLAKDELEEKKRGDLQDTLTVLAQNAEVLGPEAQERVREITDMLLEKSVPESKRLSAEMPFDPQQQMMGQQMPPGGLTQ